MNLTMCVYTLLSPGIALRCGGRGCVPGSILVTPNMYNEASTRGRGISLPGNAEGEAVCAQGVMGERSLTHPGKGPSLEVKGKPENTVLCSPVFPSPLPLTAMWMPQELPGLI